jgi:hypothetical protein
MCCLGIDVSVITSETCFNKPLPGSGFTCHIINQILAELIQSGSGMLHSEIHKPINSIWIKEVPSMQWTESVIVRISRTGDTTGCSNY